MLFLMYLLNIPFVYIGIPWLQVEFFFCVAATLFLALASLLLAINGAQMLIVAAVSIRKPFSNERKWLTFDSEGVNFLVDVLVAYISCN